ncbi:hypothetical protein BU15DRAFT_64838 [Melanogaster broomeanus]|nr:hypothetical protein BU15DRAFT_64838 [Melanogaster broomeanus]
MVEGLEVVIKYKDVKHKQVASPTLSHSAETAILKKDLAHLRVHAPSYKNVQRWPTAGTSHKVDEGHPDSLYTRWLKLCGNDPESLKLREFLSIGILIGASSSSVSVTPSSLPAKPLPLFGPSKSPPIAPRSDREHPRYLKRRLSSGECPPSPVRKKTGATSVQQIDKSLFALRLLTAKFQDASSSSAVDQQQELAGSGNSPTVSPLPTGDTGTLAPSTTLQRETIGRLTRELWDTRRESMAMQVREKAILKDLDELGARPHIPPSDDLAKLEAELRHERTLRLRAERALHEVEKECRAPFVVPALLQAFMNISELSS